MSKNKSINQVLKHKDNTLKILNNYLTDLSNTQPKKVDLLSYWLHTYTNYLKYEEIFDPKKNKRYERGDIIKVQFGFNIGSEYGGLHYAIVVDKNNPLSSPVITVIPLSSTDNKAISHHNVDLGDELYQKVRLKLIGMQQTLIEQEYELKQLLLSLKCIFDEVVIDINNKTINVPDYQYETLVKSLKEQENKINEINEKRKDIKKMLEELSKMKSGSMALVNQITCISKIRIEDPKNMHGVLHGIKISPEGLDKINEKIKDLYMV